MKTLLTLPRSSREVRAVLIFALSMAIPVAGIAQISVIGNAPTAVTEIASAPVTERPQLQRSLRPQLRRLFRPQLQRLLRPQLQGLRRPQLQGMLRWIGKRNCTFMPRPPTGRGPWRASPHTPDFSRKSTL